MKHFVILTLVFVLLCVGCSPTPKVMEKIVEQTRLVPQTVVVSQTEIVIQTVAVPQTIVVKETVVVVVTATPPRGAITWDEIVAVHREATKEQWETYCDVVKGKSVRDWLGTVVDVDKSQESGLYFLFVDMDGDNDLDFVMTVSNEEAPTLRMGQRVRISGVITEAYDLEGFPQLVIEGVAGE